MFFGILTLLTALSMATVAAVFAIYGIIAIFAGMPQFALVMGAVIELGKIVGISWLYRNWNEPTKIKYFMAPIVLVAMLLTSMGIFGLLSKAHLEQTSPVANNEIQIERLDQQIGREQSRITDAEQVISQLDQSVQALIEFDRIRGPDGALAVRESQAEQRELLRQTVDTAQSEIDILEDQKLELSQELRAIELEVGPIKYIAELIYGDGQDRTEEAVRWVIIAFIFVFDPMAILLLMAANYTLDQRKKKSVDVPSAPIIVEKKNEDMVDQDIPEPVDNTFRGGTDLQDDILPSSEEFTDIEHIEPESEPVVQQQSPDGVSKRNQVDNKIIETKGIKTVHDLGNGYVEHNQHMYQRAALKELRPDLFDIDKDNRKSKFGTQFPGVAKTSDTFIRVDTIPHRVFLFDSKSWTEITNSLPSTYLYDQEYINYLVDKIEKNEYDIDLLTIQERTQIENYLQDVVKK